MELRRAGRRNVRARRLVCTLVVLGLPFPAAVSAQADADSNRTVVTAAGERYRAGPLQRLILGRHYRDLWTASLRVEILELSTFAGGLEPLRRGGGMQTRSLWFQGADGREYAFRSVDKDPSPVLDSILRETVVADLVQDGISAAHPYGALVAAPLLDAVGILHVDPQLFVMPDDPALGEFREEFAGMLGLMEERPDENEGDRAAFRGTRRVISSETLTERLDRGPRDRVDAREYLKARLVDVFLGDWDRHRRQWRWATYDEDAPRSWLPVPRDRDQAFSKFDGVATRIVSLYMPQFVRFEDDYPSITRLHWNGRSIDRWFLAELDRPVWDSVGAAVQAALTDEVIESAARRLPAEIHELNGEELVSTLRARRDGLPEAWDELYRVLAQEAEVRATDEDEVVIVDRSEPDGVLVTVTAPDDLEAPYFSRRFHAPETREIRVYLKGGDDSVVVRGRERAGILVRLVGGEDDDRFAFDGPSDGIRVYDDQGANEVLGASSSTLNARPFEEWEWTADDRDQPRDWGRRTLPIFWTSYSSDLGLFLGGGARLEWYGFRKRPFASRLDVRAGWSPTLNKGRVEIDGHSNFENSPFFWTVGARMSRLDVLHYHGLGNASAPARESFSQVDVTSTSASAGLGVEPARWFRLTGGVTLRRTSTQENRGRLFDTLRPIYGDGIFVGLGIGGELVFDPLIDAEWTGTRFRLRLYGDAFPAALDVERAFGRTGGEVSALFASSPWPAIALGARLGAEHVLGPFPWHQAAFVGGSGSLRGWDEQRFAGDAAAYASGELRVRVSRPRVVVPVAIGLFGFGDAGRVWLEGESPGGWHTSVGGGFYLQPIQHPYLFRLGVGTGDEATKLYVALGLPY